MPQRQRHRGKHPEDGQAFAAPWLPLLRRAVDDVSMLMTRGYAHKAALKLVGDHFQLTLRQRKAVLLAACADDALERRRERQAPPSEVEDTVIDGFNLLITAETLLSGGIVFRCRDGCIRDLAGIHGSYHRVEETRDAILFIGTTLEAFGFRRVQWMLDAPVSNSGRLCAMLREIAESQGWDWEALAQNHLDGQLASCTKPVVTSDSWILDRVGRWVNLGAALVERRMEQVELIDLG